MAAPDSVVSRLGQANATGDALALFLKVFGGEVFTTFDRLNVFGDKHFVRSITSGKSAQFPLIGKASAAYHTPGTWIVGSAIKHAEKVITIDDLLVADTFIANIDEAMNHYDVRAPYSAELGRILAKTYDQNVARVLVLAARQAALLDDRPGGTRIHDANIDTDTAKMIAAMATAQQTLDENDAPSEDRWATWRPAQFWLLAQDKTLIDNTLGGSGGIARGQLPTVLGLDIVKSNNLPSADDSANAALNAKYKADFSTTYGLVHQRNAAGTVKLMDVSMEGEYEIRNQGTFMVAKYAVGHDWLLPDASVEIYKG